MSDFTLTGILTFDKDTGPSASPQSSILKDLCNISKAAFGDDFNAAEEGTEWYSFLESLSAVLANFGGASMEIFNNISVNNATGVTLDNICSLNGIHRKEAVPAYVTVTCALSQSRVKNASVPVGTKFRDALGQLWTNLEECTIPSPDVSTQMKLVSIADDPTAAYIYANSSWVVVSGGVSSAITFTNNAASKTGSPVESDAELRYRYMSSQYKQSVSTLEGLRSNILALPYINYCAIEMNTGSEAKTGSDDFAGLAGHSICVMVDEHNHNPSTAKSASSTDSHDLEIADIILRFKSLGCGTSGLTPAPFKDGRGSIECTFNASKYGGDSKTNYTINFVRVKPVSWNVWYALTVGTTDQKDTAIQSAITNAINEYANKLAPGTPVSFSAVYSIISNVLYNAGKSWQITLILAKGDVTQRPNESLSSVDIKAYQYADVPTKIEYYEKYSA